MKGRWRALCIWMSKKDVRQTLCAILAVAFLYALMMCVGITCPIKFVTGISCAGCGMTRAWLAALRFDFRAAFCYHPLFFLPPIALLLILSKNRINIKIYKILIFIFVLAFGTIYLYRMFAGDGEVVVFEPENNIVFRAIRYIKLRGGN